MNIMQADLNTFNGTGVAGDEGSMGKTPTNGRLAIRINKDHRFTHKLLCVRIHWAQQKSSPRQELPNGSYYNMGRSILTTT